MDQTFFVRFLATWCELDEPPAGADLELQSRLLRHAIDHLDWAGQDEDGGPSERVLKLITAEPILVDTSDGFHLGVDVPRHRDRLREATPDGGPPSWLRNAAWDDPVAVIDHPGVMLDDLPLDYPPLWCPDATMNLNATTTEQALALWERVADDEDSLEPVIVELPASVVRFSSVADHDAHAGLAEVPSGWNDVLTALEDAANQVLPGFVGSPVRLFTAPEGMGDPAPEWLRAQAWGFQGEPARVLVYGGEVPAELLSSAARRWIAFSLEIAFTQLREVLIAKTASGQQDERSSRVPAPSPLRSLLIVDEPEMHLHPAAQREVRDWLIERAREGATVLVATHSPTLLALPTGRAAIVAVSSDADAGTHARRIDSALLDELDGDMDQLGITRVDWLQAVAGVILVEGKHDRIVLETFFHQALVASRLVVLPLRGSNNAWALVDSEFFRTIGIRQWVLLDNTRSDLQQGKPRRPLSKEEETLRQLLRETDVRPAFYEEPDVLCALPETAVLRAFPDAIFDGWTSLVAAWKRSPRENFKAFALREMGISLSAGGFLHRVLKHTLPDDAPSPALTRTMKRLLAEAES